MLCYDKTTWRKSPTHWMPVNQKASRISVEFWANDLLSLYLVLAGPHFTAEWTNAIHQYKILAWRIWHRWVRSLRSVKKQNKIRGLLSPATATTSFSHLTTAAPCWNLHWIYLHFILQIPFTWKTHFHQRQLRNELSVCREVIMPAYCGKKTQCLEGN